MSVKRWWYGSYETLSRGEREFLYVLAGWVLALALFVGGLFALSGCSKDPPEWRGIPIGVHATCDYAGENAHTLTCVGDDAKVYICIESYRTNVRQCAPMTVPLLVPRPVPLPPADSSPPPPVTM